MVRGTDPHLSWNRPLPAPPGWLRRGPLAPGAFRSPLRSEKLAALLGLALGVTFGLCFLTGLTSHVAQHWAGWPSRPVGLYRVTQGVHVATGYLCVPLLLAKFWAVYPKLFTWPPARDISHAVSRIALLTLVASALVQVTSGVMNTARWYAFGFFFTVVHYWTSWIAIGALLIHVGAQLDVVRRALRRPERSTPPSDTGGPSTGGLSRRGLLASVGAAAGIVTVATVGQTVPVFARLSPLAPRRPDLGPQGLPVNRTAGGAGVTVAARDLGYRLHVDGPHPLVLTVADLRQRAVHAVELPITCVEGWSASATWTGIRVRDLLAEAGVPADAAIRVSSLQRRGSYSSSVLYPRQHDDPLTLLALHLNGEPLALDHGYPCRLIAPNRPGVQQTKWVTRLTVLG